MRGEAGGVAGCGHTAPVSYHNTCSRGTGTAGAAGGDKHCWPPVISERHDSPQAGRPLVQASSKVRKPSVSVSKLHNEEGRQGREVTSERPIIGGILAEASCGGGAQGGQAAGGPDQFGCVSDQGSPLLEPYQIPIKDT